MTTTLFRVLLLSVPLFMVPRMTVAQPIKPQVEPFEPRDVRLLDGPFKRAMELDAKVLLAMEPDRLLHRFRLFAGLEPKAPLYGGWEAQGISGHSLGHYLSACALMYAGSGDERFRERVNYIVDELAAVQAKRGDGYVGAIPEQDRIWAEVRRGDIRSKGFDLNGSWVPWYTQHKVMAGLIDAHRFAGNAKAKDVVVRFSDWVIDVTSQLDDEQWQKMLACEHGGMNEALADVHALTGDEKYLAIARKFHHRAVLDPLSRGERKLNGLHANTQVPKVIGAARIYELTGDDKARTVADTFWDEIVRHHTYAIGGHGSHEHLGQPGKLAGRLDPSNAEVCGTYNMLKLSRQRFTWSPDVAVGDYIERATLNHIRPSQDPKTGMFAYFLPLKAGHFMTYSTPDNSFWCCVGSGMENHVRYTDSIYFRAADRLIVNGFIPSQVTWQQQGLVVRQETKYPEEETVRISVASAEKPADATIAVRIPAWAEGASMRVNGEAVEQPVKAGTFCEIRRTWKAGDAIELRLPMKLRAEPLPDQNNRVAVIRGPVVLAADLGKTNLEPPMPYAKGQLDYAKKAPPADAADPAIVTEATEPEKWLEPVEGRPLTFRTTRGAARPRDLTLVPIYDAHHTRFAVYFDTYAPAQWSEREAQRKAEQERERQLEARTIDVFRPGEMQPERDHNFKGERTEAGEFNGRRWRHAAAGGHFSFDLAVDPEKPTELLLTYWGSDVGGRKFDVVVNDVKVATQSLDNNDPGKFFDVTHPLPAELTRGKKKVTVKFQPQEGFMAGGLFGARTMRGRD